VLTAISFGILHNMSTTTTYTIGRLAQAAGVNVETVRYYQRRGLMEEPHKPTQGFRTYSTDFLHRLLFIKRTQELGFSLSEIKQLMTLSEGSCAEVAGLAEIKLTSIQEKIVNLNRLNKVLTDLIKTCKANDDPSHCPIIESLVTEAVKKKT